MAENDSIEKFRCKSCGCTLWSLFSKDQIPMCVQCGAFTWYEPGDEEEHVIEKQSMWGVITYLIKEVLHFRKNVIDG